ncbi:UDP-N-acetylglucosamine 2-epimerase (non-hydrolyzing) [Candidatus Micrarchaeota archaeon]|jgi:UDP-N-acetylglucosamine 2-epimerase (non-hydrolysing)|nr:UDP-N-acetylglucosamine 2-epimerase (non-hydrolyzing) [Candidatus Micrarchaeota archaeon]
MKLIFVVGTRPNLMKLAPMVKRAKKYNIDYKIIHTGQHYSENLNDVFFKVLGLPDPDYNLEIHGGFPPEVVGDIMKKIHPILTSENPDYLVVFGDVSSTVGAAMAALYLNIKIIHVESGLRSGDWTMPEEVNRIITDRISTLRFVSEPSGMKNLKKEGLSKNSYLVGNVMINNLIDMTTDIDKQSLITQGDFGIVTFHRPANVDDKENLEKIASIIEKICKNTKVVFPIHPRTVKKLEEFNLIGKMRQNKNLIITEPMDYLKFIKHVKNAKFVLTDSGGIQEETTYLGVPCITLRTTTERPITTKIGTNTLVKELDAKKITAIIKTILNNKYKTGQIPDMWDDKVADRIYETLGGKHESINDIGT